MRFLYVKISGNLLFVGLGGFGPLFLFMRREELEKKIEDIVLRATCAESVELVDVEIMKKNRRFILRVVIDQPGGISHKECVDVSRRLDILLDVADFLEDRYVLEVSSPGLDRALKKPSDYERSIGKLVRFTVHEEPDRWRSLTGRLLKYAEDNVTVACEDLGVVSMPLKTIKKMKLEPELEKSDR